MSNYKLTIDAEADAAYFYVSDAKSIKTIEINESILIDADIDGKTVGVEFLSLEALGAFKKEYLNEFLSEEDCAELESLLEKPLRSYLMTNRLALR